MRFHILTWVEKVGGIEEAQVKTIPSFMTAIIIFIYFFFGSKNSANTQKK